MGRSEKKRLLVDYLRERAYGLENAVPAWVIHEDINIKPYELRILKHELIVNDKELIGATAKDGYFYISDFDEVVRCIREMKSRIGKMQEVVGAYGKAWHGQVNPSLF
jgi:hypothetical protein